MMGLEQRVATHCLQHNLRVELSYQMPPGYETAFGTYAPDSHTLHLNVGLLKDAPQTDALFYLYHELRHAEQYQHPERFDSTIRESLPYVILYDGHCFKQVDGHWRSCKLDGEETYFTAAYLSLPYELDANTYACQKVEVETDSASAAEAFRHFWLPEHPLPQEEFVRLFQQIDRALRQ